jgi:acyl carrier protein
MKIASSFQLPARLSQQRKGPRSMSAASPQDWVQLSQRPAPARALPLAGRPAAISLQQAVAQAALTPLRELDEQNGDPHRVAERVTKIVKDQLKVDEEKIVPEAEFQADLGADSLDQVEILMNCETEFEIEIPEEDATQIVTVGDAIDCVQRKLAEKP